MLLGSPVRLGRPVRLGLVSVRDLFTVVSTYLALHLCYLRGPWGHLVMVRRTEVAPISYMLDVVLHDVNTFIRLILKPTIQVDPLVPTLQIRRLRSKEAEIIGVRLYR